MSDCHIVTPLILSDSLTRLAGRKVYLKLDCLQPSGNTIVEIPIVFSESSFIILFDPGSFKIRGIGRTCSHAAATLGATRLVGSSGGSDCQYKLSSANLLEGFSVSAVFVPQLPMMLFVDFNEI